jgi:methylmalonyl-CoA mutase N-terminal domain/subunit
MERQAEEIFTHIEDAGSGSMLEGTFACIEDGWFIAEIADAAYQFQSKLAKGEWIQVGVNGYVEGDDDPRPPTLYIDPAVETQQLASLAAVKQSR